jgi:prevent-host-death family protein
MCYSHPVTREISQRELRNDSAAVLREVQAGQTIVVTRNGTPVAELRPLPPRRYVPRSVIADAARGAPRVDAARLRADLDRVVDQSTDG